VTASASGGAGLSLEVVSAHADVGVTVSASASVTASLSETQPVKAGYWGNAYWGRALLPITFHEAYYAVATCKKAKDIKITKYFPTKNNDTVGWCKWISKTSLGSRPSQCNVGPYIAA
jgi:hypothetical protein